MNAPVIYLDYNATTPVAEEVLEAMLPYFSDKFGNAASATHWFGTQAKDAVEKAREQVASALHSEAEEIIFTSGATESINLALQGIFRKYRNKGNHIVTVKTEHKAVLDTCRFLERQGASVTYLNVNAAGLVDLDELRAAITDKTILVAVMYANNETGVLQDIPAIADIVHERNSLFFCDATQAVGKIPVNVQHDGIDVMALSAHKFYGPKGTGALYVRRKNPRVVLDAIQYGGGHEKGWRSGTLNVPGIVGLGAACSRITAFSPVLRDQLEAGLTDLFGSSISIHGINSPRLPNTSSIAFPFKAVDFIRHTKHQLAVATGSACTSATQEPSHVLIAMGIAQAQAAQTIRFSLGKTTTAEDIDRTLSLIRLIPHNS